MPSAAKKLMTIDEFLAWEREQPERHEFDGFVVTAMTGGSLNHSTIASNFDRNLSSRLRGTGCRVFRGDAKIIANGAIRYPDVSVTCSRVVGGDDIVPEPVVIIEVVSPSTERVDRSRKKFDYFATPSVRQYAIVEQDERRIDLYTRTEAGWINEIVTDTAAGSGAAATLNLPSIGVAVPLDAIYEDTELAVAAAPAATPQPADAGSAPAA